MKRNRYLVPLGALMAVLALGALVMMVRASADDMLYQAADLMGTVQDAHAIVEVQLETPEDKTSGTVEVWGRRDAGPNGEPAFRVEVLDSSKQDAIGMVAVADGDQVWIWKPAENTVYVGTREELKARMAEYDGEFDHSDFDHQDFNEEEMPQTPQEAVDKLLEYFTAERNGSDMIAGEGEIVTAAEKLRLVPIPEQMPEEFRANGGLVTIWLRSDDSAPLAAEYSDGAVGSAKAVATLLELNQGVADERFTFDIPAGADIVNLADIEPPASLTTEEAAKLADFDVLSAAELPTAARLAGINEVRGAIVQRYRLPDGESFTIAQGTAGAAETPDENGELVAVRGGEGLLFSSDDGQRTLLTWTEGDVTFWVGGDLTPEQALAIAESLN